MKFPLVAAALTEKRLHANWGTYSTLYMTDFCGLLTLNFILQHQEHQHFAHLPIQPSLGVVSPSASLDSTSCD